MWSRKASDFQTNKRKAKDKRDKLVCALGLKVQRTLAQVLVD